MRKHAAGLLALCPLLLCGCAPAAAQDAAVTPTPAPTPAAPYRAEIALDGKQALVTGGGAALEDGVLTISEGGCYRLHGSFTGAVSVDAGGGDVELVLCGASVTGAGCALYAQNAASLRLTAAVGTENLLSDGLAAPSKESAAAVYADCPLVLGGEGALTVTAGGGCGAEARGGMTLESGALCVTAADAGLKAKGFLNIYGGTLSVVSGGDALRASAHRGAGGDIAVAGGSLALRAKGRGLDAAGALTVSDGSLSVVSAGDALAAGGELTVSGGSLTLLTGDEGLQADGDITVTGGFLSVLAAQNGLSGAGAVTLSGGETRVTSGTDAVQAETLLTVSGGFVTVRSGPGGGDAINQPGEEMMGGPGGWGQTASAETVVLLGKGLKCAGDIVITGGVISLDCGDDAVHAGGAVRIDDCAMTVVSNDDAVHADTSLIVNGGVIDIRDCFEGLEALTITVNGGVIDILSVNDGVNANGPDYMMGWGQTASAETVETWFRMTGGVIRLAVTGNSANLGDGVDSNGSVYIDGGELYVSTAGGTREAGIDYGNGEFVITGGTVIAGGSSMMAEPISTASTQCCALLSLNTVTAANTPVTVTDAAGRVLCEATLADGFSCLVVTSPKLLPGGVYTVTMGSLTQTLDFTQTTVINSGGMGMMGGMGGGRW